MGYIQASIEWTDSRVDFCCRFITSPLESFDGTKGENYTLVEPTIFSLYIPSFKHHLLESSRVNVNLLIVSFVNNEILPNNAFKISIDDAKTNEETHTQLKLSVGGTNCFSLPSFKYPQ